MAPIWFRPVLEVVLEEAVLEEAAASKRIYKVTGKEGTALFLSF